ncbi:MAG: hypothetical protein LBJ47_05150 [Tannerella sp.]|jgi:hypothetical protein|nr:hypothetical protein [Tannerella sp.]
MDTTRKIIVLLCLLASCGLANAQGGLRVDGIFDGYGRQKGAVLIELAKDVLGRHTRISRYRSLTIPVDSAAVRTTLDAIRTDLKNGTVLAESQKDGMTETGYYHLSEKTGRPENEYILFSAKSPKMTLIYIRGDFPPSRLEDELGKLKDLFIKVDNKRIKL